MAYDKYSTQKVFQDELANIYCNKILDNVHTEFASSETKLVATDDLSRIIQGQAKSELPVIPFVTSDAGIYKYLVKNLQSIVTVEAQVSFKNRIQLVTSFAYFEFWFDNTAWTTININGLYCRNLNETYPSPVSPYNIVLAEEQVFTASASNELYFQGWAIDVGTPVKFFHVIGTAAPDPIAINVNVENVFLTQPEGKYSDFKYQTSIVNWESPFSQYHLGHIQLSGDAAYLYPGIDITEAELQKNIITSCVDLNVLEPGQRTWELLIEIHGVRTDSGLIDRSVSFLRIPFSLDILDTNSLVVIPQNLLLSHVKASAPLEGKDIQIYTGGDFRISIPDYFDLTGGNIVEKTPTYQRRHYEGVGSQVLTLKATAAFDNYTGSIYSGYIEVVNRHLGSTRSSRGRVVESITLTAYLFETHGFSFEPDSLEFLVIKGLENAEPQEIDVVSTEGFTVSFPYWLQVSPAAGTIFQKLKAEPINSNNLVAGQYYGEITLTSANASGEIPVVLKVVESIDEGFSSSEINFTHDHDTFTALYSGNSGERASCRMEIKAYDYNGFPKSTSHSFKGAFFNYKYRIHLGEIVARRFAKLSAPSEIGFRHYDLENETFQLFQIFKYYKPANAIIDLEIENRSTGSIVVNESFSNVLFVRGRRPTQFDDDYGILDYSAPAIRVTAKSQMLFNFMRRISQHEIKVYRNNAIYKTITHTPGNDSLFGLAMFFKDFIPGDVIDIRLYMDEENYHAQQYVMFPPQPESNHIVWLNEYNVLQSYEFTGAYNFSSETKVVSSKTYQNLVEQIENLEVNKEQRLKINTGWILKSNQVIIDSIVRSKQVWLVHQGREISMRPVAMNFSNDDSRRELYSYDVEFIINRENELEVCHL